jgi:hypothetical protein
MLTAAGELSPSNWDITPTSSPTFSASLFVISAGRVGLISCSLTSLLLGAAAALQSCSAASLTLFHYLVVRVFNFCF